MISKSLSPRMFNAAVPLTDIDMERRSQPGFWHRMLDQNIFRKTAQFALDMIVFMTAFILAYLLRFDFNIPPIELFHMAVQLPGVVIIQLGALYLLKGHRLIWRYISLDDVYRFVLAALLSTAPVVMLRLTLPEASGNSGRRCL